MNGHPSAIFAIVRVVFLLSSFARPIDTGHKTEATMSAKFIRVHHLPTIPRLQSSCYEQSYEMNDFTLKLTCTIRTTDPVVTSLNITLKPSSYPQVYCLYSYLEDHILPITSWAITKNQNQEKPFYYRVFQARTLIP